MAGEKPNGNDHRYTTASGDDDDDNRAECGVGSFKPAALRLCANMTAFTGVCSVSALISNTLTTYVNSQVG